MPLSGGWISFLVILALVLAVAAIALIVAIFYQLWQWWWGPPPLRLIPQFPTITRVDSSDQTIPTFVSGQQRHTFTFIVQEVRQREGGQNYEPPIPLTNAPITVTLSCGTAAFVGTPPTTTGPLGLVSVTIMGTAPSTPTSQCTFKLTVTDPNVTPGPNKRTTETYTSNPFETNQ